MPRLPPRWGAGSRGFGYGNGPRVLSPLCDLNQERRVEAAVGGFERSGWCLWEMISEADRGSPPPAPRHRLQAALFPSSRSPLPSSFPLGVRKAECSLALLPAVWPRQRVRTPLLPHSFELVLLPPAPWGVSPFPPSARHLRASGWPRSGHTSLTLVSLPSLLATELVCGGHPTSYVSGPGRPHPWVARALVKCGAARGHTPGLGRDAFGASRGGAVLPPAPCGWVGGGGGSEMSRGWPR